MTPRKIARDYLGKVEARLEARRLFLARGRNDDVIREALLGLYRALLAVA